MAETSMRIGDEDREQAAAILGDHFSAGRLEHAEFDERIARIYAARTEADLAPVFVDLPAAALDGRPFSKTAAHARHRIPASTIVPVLVLVLVAAMAWVALTDRPPFFLVPLVWFAIFRWGWFGRRTRRRAAHLRWPYGQAG
jgi:hypothetical protein